MAFAISSWASGLKAAWICTTALKAREKQNAKVTYISLHNFLAWQKTSQSQGRISKYFGFILCSQTTTVPSGKEQQTRCSCKRWPSGVRWLAEARTGQHFSSALRVSVSTCPCATTLRKAAVPDPHTKALHVSLLFPGISQAPGGFVWGARLSTKWDVVPNRMLSALLQDL